MLPILFQNPDFILYSYPLLMGLGWGVAYQVFFGYFPSTLKLRDAQILFWGIFLTSWFGAKVLYLLTSDSDVSNSFNFWMGGGFVFYGGFLSAILFLAILRLGGMKLSWSHLWPMLPALTIGHAIGRIGCFLAGCCFGAETDAFWGMHMHGASRHPTQILEALSLGLIGFLVIKFRERKSDTLIIYLLGYGIFRFSIEFLRGDEARGQWGVLSPSQWISCGMILVGCYFFSKKLKT